MPAPLGRPPFIPFMQGSPRFEPGLRRIDPEHWLIPDTEKDMALANKRHLLDTRREEVFGAMDGSENAQFEAAQMIYAVLGKTSEQSDELPLLMAFRLVSDDLCVLEKREGVWVLSAACLCSPTHFSLKHVLGGSMAALHGPVPGGDPALAGKINLMFDRVAPGLVLERFNWTVQAGAARYMPDAAPMRALAAATPLQDAKKVLHLRIERQTILRLPQTGAILFCIRVCIDPLRDLAPEQQSALYQSWTAAPKNVRDYKGWKHIDPLIHAFFKKNGG